MIGPVGAAILFIVLSPAGSAVSHSLGGTTFSPPFRGSVVPSVYIYYASCAKSQALTPTFKLSTGLGAVNASASSKSCPASSTNYAYAGATFLASFSVPYRSGPVTFFVNVTYTMAGHVSFHPGTCKPSLGKVAGACYRLTEASLGASAYVLDTTVTQYNYSTASFPPIGQSPYNTSNCKSGICTSSSGGSNGTISTSGSFSWTIVLGRGMMRSHSYQVGLSFYATTDSECTATGSAKLLACSGSAWVNLSSGGNGMKLVSIVEI